MIYIRSFSLLIILILIISCGREYVSPEIKSIKNVILEDQNNDLAYLSFDLEIFNKNNFDFKYASQVAITKYSDAISKLISLNCISILGLLKTLSILLNDKKRSLLR